MQLLTNWRRRRHLLFVNAAPLSLIFCLAQCVAAFADATSAAPGQYGHSSHGAAFDEGPRQSAVLLPGMGVVNFPITTSLPEAQAFFHQGVAQLHGFWYYEAERSFRQVALLDPECAMAFWGMAMANVHNGKRAAEFLKKGAPLAGKASPREQQWIAGATEYFGGKGTERERRQALARALEMLVRDHPEEVEAKAFLIFWLWDNRDKGLPMPSLVAMDALVQSVLAANPDHPGAHHYRIHLWNKEDDRQALGSAARLGQSAPGVAHQWHMPGHTYVKLRRFADAAWQQEASARVDHAAMAAARILPEQTHNYAHNNDWLVENLAHVGRVHDAISLAKNMIELPRLLPRSMLVGKGGRYDADGGGFAMGRNRLLETALRYELWGDLLELESTPYLAPAEQPINEVHRLRALGIAAFSQNKRDLGAQKVAALEAQIPEVRAARIAAADEAEAAAKRDKKTPEEISKAMADALLRGTKAIETAESALAEVRLFAALAAAQPGEVRLQLSLAKGLPAARKARIFFQLGDRVEAEQAARQAVKDGEGEAPPLAVLADVLWRLGKKPEALEAFERLRQVSGSLDLDVGLFSRLQPLAKELKLPSDWRIPAVPSADAGVRPALASLGPFRWSPYPASPWTLPGQGGESLSLAGFRGGPVLVVFYLGAGCPHCIEQLNILAPLHTAFAEAGIRIVAVSTDSAEGLHQTFAKAEGGAGFPFPLVADPALEVFKAYRAFDDFEKQPLHGTFLVDAAGMVRWQDISAEPMRDAGWLLREARRLLGMAAGSVALGVR